MVATILRMWDGDPPGYIEGAEGPTLIYYPAKERKSKGTVVICPGGAYSHLADHEGRGYAEYLNSYGIDCYVLKYRVDPYRFPYELLDARRAVRYARDSAEMMGLDPDKIAIMGSSAGGHLAALTSTYKGEIAGEGADGLDRVDYRPNYQILCYPVIDRRGHAGSFAHLLGSEAEQKHLSVTPTLLADESTPPAFLWHTAEDGAVNVLNSYDYAARLKTLGVPVEMHIYPYGRHGLGLAPQEENRHLQSWAPLLIEWLRLYGFFDE